MGDIRQYMQEQGKAARVDLLLSEYKAVTRRNGKYSPEQLAVKLDFERRVMALNSRGQKGLYT